MKWYPWLNNPYRNILNLYQQHRWHHALLIHSIPGGNNGELSLCYAIICWMMCKYHNDIKSCGICNSCKLMKSGTNPDLYTVEIENKSNIIGINSIRTMIDRVYERAYHGSIKIIWIPQSDYLTVQAATALLKTIEEPPENTYFLLVCKKIFLLLPTLRSRCLYWSLLAPQEIIGICWLKKNGFNDIITSRTALRLCNGAVPAAEELLNPKKWQERLNLCTALQNAYTTNNLVALLPYLNKDDNMSLHWLLSFLSDALKWQYGVQEFLVNLDKKWLVELLATRWTAIVLHSNWQYLLYCMRKLQEINNTNNRELLLTHYLIMWEQGFVPYFK